jgi:hypothetical protein
MRRKGRDDHDQNHRHTPWRHRAPVALRQHRAFGGNIQFLAGDDGFPLAPITNTY